MKLTVLVDNNSIIDDYLLAEPGLSFFIEDGEEKILFDLGYSEIFLQNALKLGIDLSQCTTIAISHGHTDHTGGLEALIKHMWEKGMEKEPHKPRLVLHPDIIGDRAREKKKILGIFSGRRALEKTFQVQESSEPLWLTDRLVYLGEIERQFPYEGKKKVKDDRGRERMIDYLREDTALAYLSTEGLVIITGCSHAGICNIVEYARKVCREDRVVDIIGGLHLQKPSREQMEGTKEYLAGLGLKAFHACHCTDLKSKIALDEAVELTEVGVGLQLEF